MADKSLRVRLSATVSQFRGEMGSASQAVQAFGRDVDRVSTSHANLGKIAGTAAVAIGVGVAAALVKAGQAAAQFEQQMRNVNSISGLSEQQFRQMSSSVIDLSRKLPQSANTLAAGLYDIASSGFQGADGLKVLKASAEAATAGVSDTATSAKAITAVLNAYGKTAADAGDVSDVLFQTVNLGVVSFGELASVIGDVVGLGAQAGIGIDQLGSAIATMTLSGISGAEAGTSLNRTIQSLIQPSDALTLVYRNLGYESGASALKTKGLHAVMEDLRKVTGGNVTSMLQLFPNIRAARGAMALMSNEGQNYNRVAAEIEDRNKRAGATHRALAEQMKSTALQFRLFANDVNAAAIVVGTKLLPIVRGALTGIQAFARDGVRFLGDQMERLAPFFDGVAATGRNLVTIGRDLLTSFAPLGKAMVALVGGTVLVSLNSLATVLGSITGFLARHQGLVNTLAALYGVKLASSVATAAAAFVAARFEASVDRMAELVIVTGRAVGSFGLLRTAIAGIAIGGGVAAIGGIVTALQNASAHAKDLVASMAEGVDKTSGKGLQAWYDQLSDLELKLESTGKAAGGWKNALRGMGEDVLPFVANGVDDTRAKVKALKQAMDETAGFKRNLFDNLAEVQKQTGLNRKEAEKLSQSLGVDLTKAFGQSDDARAKLIDHVKQLGVQTGLTGKAMSDATGLDIDKMEALAKSVEDLQTKVGEAFASATDLIAGWDPSKSDLATFFKSTIHDAQTFANQIANVAQRGLDPNLIADLLKAGPQKALPILSQLVADHSGRLIKAYNDTEKTLAEINTRVVEMARLTALAVAQPTDALVRDLGAAMAIATTNMSQAQASVESIAKATGRSVDDVKRIAGEFGITISGMAASAAGIGPAVAAGVAPAVASLGTLQTALQNVSRLFANLASPGGGATIGAYIPPPAPVPGVIQPPPGPSTPTRGVLPSDAVQPPTKKVRALGGVDPHVTTSETVLYGERQTGGEAFIPRIGDRGRALATLATAASWYGADLLPMAGGGILGDEWKAWKKWSGPALGWKGAHAVIDLARQMGGRSARGFGVLKDKATGHKPYMDYGDWGARYNAENLTGDPGIAPSNKGARLNIGGDGYYPRSGRRFATGGILYPSSAPMGSSAGYGVDIAGRIEAAIGRALAVARPIEINAPQQADPLHVASAVEWALRY